MSNEYKDPLAHIRDMVLAIFECHREARGIEENSVGMSLKFECAYRILYESASRIPKEQRETVYDHVKLCLDNGFFKHFDVESKSFSSALPVWIEFAKQALEADVFSGVERSILRRYILMRQVWKVSFGADCPVINHCADYYIKLKRSILQKPVDTLNIYPGNPTRRVGLVSPYARGMIMAFLYHIQCRDEALKPFKIQTLANEGLDPLFGNGIMFADLCENQWSTLVLCLARSLFEEIVKAYPDQREGAQSLAISFTILLNAYYPIDSKFLGPILDIVPENLHDLSDPAVIDRYYQDVFDRFDLVLKWTSSWFYESVPVNKVALQFYREFFLEGISLGEKHVQQECLGLGPDLSKVVDKLLANFRESEAQMYREIDYQLLEKFADSDEAINKAARNCLYWGAFKPAWIKIALGCSGFAGKKPVVRAYGILRPVILACRESFGKYPTRSSLTLEEIRSNKCFSDFNPELVRKSESLFISLDGPVYVGDSSSTVTRTLDQILPAYEYVLRILSFLHPSAKCVEISQIDLLAQKNKIDWYVMDVVVLFNENSDPARDQASAFSRVLYELIIELFGKHKHPLASSIAFSANMSLFHIHRCAKKIGDIDLCTAAIRELWEMMRWKGNLRITQNGKELANINLTTYESNDLVRIRICHDA